MNRYIAELLGTFVLVFASCGSAVLAGDKIGFLGVSLAFGLSLLAMVYAIGPISGCHINPAVTVGLLLSKKIDPTLAGGYIVAQIVGAILAAAILLVIAQGAPGFWDAASVATTLERWANPTEVHTGWTRFRQTETYDVGYKILRLLMLSRWMASHVRSAIR